EMHPVGKAAHQPDANRDHWLSTCEQVVSHDIDFAIVRTRIEAIQNLAQFTAESHQPRAPARIVRCFGGRQTASEFDALQQAVSSRVANIATPTSPTMPQRRRWRVVLRFEKC